MMNFFFIIFDKILNVYKILYRNYFYKVGLKMCINLKFYKCFFIYLVCIKFGGY